MDMNSTLTLLGFIAVCAAAATSGAMFRPGEWYERLRKPGWRPPNWLFPPVWTVLYVMIAVSGWLVWFELGWSDGAAPLGIWAVQLVLNAAWSGLFFGLRRPGLALVEMALLWIAIAATIAVFWPVSQIAAWLMAPYLLWVSFAFALNLSIWRLNREGAASREAA